MKSLLPTGCLLLLALPSLAGAQSQRMHPVPATESGLKVMPIAMEAAEPRSTASLRDSLRQPLDETDNKPYRMSSQERQRLREQLRSQSPAYEMSKK